MIIHKKNTNQRLISGLVVPFMVLGLGANSWASMVDMTSLMTATDMAAQPQALRSTSTTILTAEDLGTQNASNLSDYLFSGVPGVSIQRWSNLGYAGSSGSGLGIRGLSGTRTAIFVDGIPSFVNGAHSVLDQYTPNMIERIEITRGISGVSHGTNAVGGVIDIITKKPALGTSAAIKFIGGSSESGDLNANLGYAWQGGHFRFNISDKQTNDFRPQSAYSSTTFGFSASNTVNRSTFNVLLSQTNSDIENPGEITAPSTTKSKFTLDPSMMALAYEYKTEKTSSKIAFYRNDITMATREFLGVSGAYRNYTQQESGVRLKHSHQAFERATFTVGLDAVEYSDDRTNATGTADYVENVERSFSPYVQYLMPLGSKAWMDAGLRYTRSKQFGVNLSPELGLVQNVNKDLSLRYRLAKGLRTPQINEVYAPFAVANADLTPEEFTSVEVGANQRFGKRATLDVSIWWLQGKNLIVTQGTGSSQQSVNDSVSKENTKGFEASYKVKMTKNLNLGLVATVMDIPDSAGAPKNTFDIALGYHKNKWQADLVSRYGGEFVRIGNDFSGSNSALLTDYHVMNLQVSYANTKQFRTFVSIDNLTDADYATVLGYPQSPASFFLGFEASWSE